MRQLFTFFFPTLILSLVVHTIVSGGTIAEGLVTACISGVYGVQLYFNLQRRNNIEKKQLQVVKKDLAELKTFVSHLRMERDALAKVTAPQTNNLGDIAWKLQSRK